MNINDVIEIIPKLFLYFIPGYIAIHIKSHFKNEKSAKDSHVLIMSIVVTFIINILVELIINVVNKVICKPIVLNDYNKPVLLLIGAIIIGCLWVLFYDSKLEKWINIRMKSNTTSEPNVWNKAMKCENGAWVRVYLYDQNILYEGKLLNYTIDPEEEKREILLGSFTSYNINDKKEIEVYSDNKKMVLINCNELTNIEILKD